MTSIIYTNQKSKRKPANTAKRREQQVEWEALLKKYDVKGSKKITSKNPQSVYVPKENVCMDRSSRHIPSRGDGIGNAVLEATPQYTGDTVVGVAVMHKSNLVPIFSQEEAINASHMRR